MDHVPAATAARPLHRRGLRQRGLQFPPASVVTYSFQLRDVLLTTGDYLSVVAASAVPVFNAKRTIVKILPIDLGLQAKARPVAIFTTGERRTLSPVTELFIESVRKVANTLTSQRRQPQRASPVEWSIR